MRFEAYREDKNCVHECVYPDNWTTVEPPEGRKPAREYKYQLDTFQRESVWCLERNESVLVAAHTSAGKTTVAEYAISLALNANQRVVYTSPIKALSNQKYRDLSDTYQDVGLMTGDVTIKPNASCMIMTTEILRSMLFRGSEIVREVAWVIFDEVHYMRDKERGVVWEETMVLLPDTVRYVFLSATIPNSREFAEWLCTIKHQPCHVVYTNYRPVPLVHFVYPAGGSGIYLICDEQGTFKHENLGKAFSAMEAAVESEAQLGSSKRGRAALTGGSAASRRGTMSAAAREELLKLIKMCSLRNMLPVIVFAFSKKDCESNCLVLSGIDLTSDEEKAVIKEVFDNATSTLCSEDQTLPQIASLFPILSRGIGVHHGGLLPILKELTEILFQEGLIKVLFCTETFAMGVNMPAKTVVFTQLTKWDGVDRRPINSGEFIQMAGRAGRRGKDDKGVTILMLNDSVNPDSILSIYNGKPLSLDSQFRVSYPMLLNMIRMEGVDPSYIVERSFAQFQANRSVVEMTHELNLEKSAIAKAQDDMDDLAHSLAQLDSANGFVIPEDPSRIESFTPQTSRKLIAEKLAELTTQVAETGASARSSFLKQTKSIVNFLNPGRLVKLDDSEWYVLMEVHVPRSAGSSSADKHNQRSNKRVDHRGGADHRGGHGGQGGHHGHHHGHHEHHHHAHNGHGSAGQQDDSAGPYADSAGHFSDEEESYAPASAISMTLVSRHDATSKLVDLERLVSLSTIRANLQVGGTKPVQNNAKHAQNSAQNSSSNASSQANAAVSAQLNAILDLDQFKAAGGPPILDPVKDMKITNPKVVSSVEALRVAEAQLIFLTNFANENLNSARENLNSVRKNLNSASENLSESDLELVNRFSALSNLKREKALTVNRLTSLLAVKCHEVARKEEVDAMLQIMKELRYVSEEGVITAKGKVASEISATDSLLLAEMVFSNVFQGLKTEAEVVAFLSVFIVENDDKNEDTGLPVDLGQGLVTAISRANEVCASVCEVMERHNPPNFVKDDYLKTIRCQMITPVFRWMQGKSFKEVLDSTSMFEGDVIRVIKRLEELLREMILACRAIGLKELEDLLVAGRTKLKRGIVFQASLYL